MTDQITDPFAEQAIPAAKFTNVGDMHTIIVRKADKKIDTDFKTREIKTWPNGDPKHVFILTGEDGETGETVAWWCRGNLIRVIKDAMAKAGVATVIDTKITAKHHALGDGNDAKLFKAAIEKVAPAPVADDPFGGDTDDVF